MLDELIQYVMIRQKKIQYVMMTVERGFHLQTVGKIAVGRGRAGPAR